MNTTLKMLIAATLLAGSAVAGAGCMRSQHEHARTSGEVLDDSTITTRVKAALLAEKDVNSFDIKVKTFDGLVQLSGFVDSQWQVDKAEQVAAAVTGVRHVTNDLIHKTN